MIDHIGIEVQDYPRCRAFYVAALAPLGYEVLMEFGPEAGLGFVGAGLGADGKPDFWIEAGWRSGPLHVAFRTKDRAVVEAFHAAALAAGGHDNGTPGLRPHYHPGYFGAFVTDPEGNNIEVVCHEVPGAPPARKPAAKKPKPAAKKPKAAARRGKRPAPRLKGTSRRG